MADVIAMPGVAQHQSIGADESIVAACEKLLEQVRAGEIMGMGFFLIETGYSITTGRIQGKSSPHLMVAGASALQYRAMKAYDSLSD